MDKTISIELTETQMKALEQFIGRVNLNAKEVPVWNDLIAAFNNAGAPEPTENDLVVSE